MIDKLTSRLIRSQIRKVLLNVWDPIGVKNEPNAQDEYDGYVGEIYDLLVKKATDREITDRLLYIVQETMGLDAAKAEDMQPTVRALQPSERFGCRWRYISIALKMVLQPTVMRRMTRS